MKVFVSLVFVFFGFVASAQQAIVSNGRSSVTIDNSGFSIELSDSFFKTTEIVAKLIDENGKTIPCTRTTVVIQPKKGDAVVFYVPNKKSVFALTAEDILRLSHLASGSRVIFSFETFNKVKYPKLMYGYGISIR